MYALTLWQPWAWAVASGMKCVENRPWSPPGWIIGERIAIHAGQKYDQASEDTLISLLPCRNPLMPMRQDVVHGAIIATTVVARVEDSAARVEMWRPGQGRWYSGPFGWLLRDTVRLDVPIPCRGYQKLWRVKGDAAARARRGSAGR